LKKELEGAKGQVIHTHSVSVEYITIERQAEELDSRITEMMQELDHKKNEKESL
jgi:predicted ATP-grasp superfamily ATP-dependent carboligase